MVSSDLANDEASVLAMLSLVQAAYDSGKINETVFLQAESELVKKLSQKQKPVYVASAEPGAESGETDTDGASRLLTLLRQREELEKTLDSLADAVASGKITEETYERLYIANSEKLSRVLSGIDFEAKKESEKYPVPPMSRDQFPSREQRFASDYNNSSTNYPASWNAPAASQQYPQPQAQTPVQTLQNAAPASIPKPAHNDQSFFGALGNVFSPPASLSAQPEQVKKMAPQPQLPPRAEEIRNTINPEAQYSAQASSQSLAASPDFSQFRAAVSILEKSQAKAEKDVEQATVKVGELASKFDSISGQGSLYSESIANLKEEVAALSAAMSSQEGFSAETAKRFSEVTERLAKNEQLLNQRFEEIRQLVAQVEEIHGSSKLAHELQARSDDLHRQVLRTEKLADLMGRTFVDSTKKFAELDEFRHRQQAISASISALANSVKELSDQVRAIADPSPVEDLRAQVKALKDRIAKLEAADSGRQAQK